VAVLLGVMLVVMVLVNVVGVGVTRRNAGWLQQGYVVALTGVLLAVAVDSKRPYNN
jgi:hypothetical protein